MSALTQVARTTLRCCARTGTMLGIALLLYGCAGNFDRAAQEADASANTFEWLHRHYGFAQTPNLNLLLQRVTERLSSAIYSAALETEFDRGGAAQFHDYPWQVVVLNSDRVNAFSLGAGLIVLTKGAFRSSPSEAALAAVVAHEMAHQMLGHTIKALIQTQTAASSPEMSFTLDEEIAADTLSLKLLRVAGYDLRCAAQSLTMDYRSVDEDVSFVPPRWLELRMANILQLSAEFQHRLPGTTNSREFIRAQNEIM